MSAVSPGGDCSDEDEGDTHDHQSHTHGTSTNPPGVYAHGIILSGRVSVPLGATGTGAGTGELNRHQRERNRRMSYLSDGLDDGHGPQCHMRRSTLDEQYSFGVYAGVMGQPCAIAGCRDACGYGPEGQGNPADLDEPYDPEN